MGEEVAKQYGSQLLELKVNSKPVINVLTMMAEDYIRHGPVVVQTIEKHLNRVSSGLKLPVLYLIDSIVKNVKKDYNNLFTQNLVSTFCGVFEQVDEKTKQQMFRLRQTWNEVFPLRKLYAIDVRCNQLDKNWPIISTPPPNSSKIHVNPKFLNTSPRSSVSNSSVTSPDASVAQPTSYPIVDATTAEMRAKLLLKQKELLELQHKKVELELMQAKAAIEARTLQEKMGLRPENQPHAQVTQQENKRQEELESAIQQQKRLLQRAEMAKNKTDIAHHILSSYPNSSTTTSSTVKTVTVTQPQPQTTTAPIVSDPRLARKLENKAKIEANAAKDKSKGSSAAAMGRPTKSHESPKAPARISHESSPVPPKISKSSSPTIKPSSEIRDSHIKIHHEVAEIDMFAESNRKLKDIKDRRSKENSREKDGAKERKISSRERSRSPERSRASSIKDKKSKSNLKDTKKGDRRVKDRDGKKETMKKKRESDEDSEDEMKGFSPLKIKPKRLSTTDSDSKGSPPSGISPTRGLSGTREKKECFVPAASRDFNQSKRIKLDSPFSRSDFTSDKDSRIGTPGSISSSQSSIREEIPERSPSVSPTQSCSKRSRTSSERSDKDSKHLSNKGVDKKDPKLRSSRYGKEKRSTTRDRGNEKEVGSSAHKPDQWKDYNERQKAVLKRNYRKTSGVDLEEEENLVPMPQTNQESSAMNESGAGDVDLRFQALKDVDLREGQDEPAAKKAKASENNTSMIDHLFGREDVDLRQPRSGNWSQVKKPLRGDRHVRGSSQDDDDVRDILQQQNRNHPPTSVSPAHSVSSSVGSCDPLGRPLLYNKLPDDPQERKKSLDSRSHSIDPVEHFRTEFIDRALAGKGELSQSEVKKIFAKAQEHVDQGVFSTDQYLSVIKQLTQIQEASALSEAQQMQLRGSSGPWAAPQEANPWTESAQTQGPWAAPAPDFQPRGPVDCQNMLRFPLGGQPGTWLPRMNMGANWNNNPLPRPSGPNPFEEALRPRVEDMSLIPRANELELRITERDTASSIPIDKIMRELRFYGDTAVILMGVMSDEPKEIAFQRDSRPRTVLINGKPLDLTIGEVKRFELNRKQHSLKIGAPTRELYIDDRHYEVCFGGPTVRIHVDNRMHSFQLIGPPPQVELGEVPRHDLVAGRVNLIIDAVQQINVYLDEKPQKIDLFNEPIILRFCDDFRTVTLNGRPFPTNFGARLPFLVTIPNAGQHYFRFSSLTPATEKAIGNFVRARKGGPMEIDEAAPTGNSDGFGPFRGRGRGGRGGRGRGVGPRGRDPIIEPLMMPHVADRNPLDIFNNLFPSQKANDSSEQRRLRKPGGQVHSYESEVKGEGEKQPEESNNGMPDIASILALAAKFGMLPSNESTSGNGENEIPKEEVISPAEEKPELPKEKIDQKPTIPPLETIDVSLVSDKKDNLKERRDTLIDQLWTGVQCASCGLRFPPDQTVRYSQHLDWHFRHNRRQKTNAKKPQSRGWYYSYSDWMQYEDVEDIEERAASIFETQEDTNGEAKSPNSNESPKECTVLASLHKGATCPQCLETFTDFYDEDLEEWRLRDAMVDETEGEAKLYHPACHLDYLKSLVQESEVEKLSEDIVIDCFGDSDNVRSTDTNNDKESEEAEQDDDEVLIIKEGKKDVVLDEIALDDVDTDEILVKDNNDSQKNEIETKNNEESETCASVIEKDNTNINVNNLMEKSVIVPSYTILSKSVLSPIVINDEDSSSNFLPGISEDSSGGVFGFALGALRERSESPEAVEEKKIVYKSMAFDIPKIKVEPMDTETEEQVSEDPFFEADKVSENNAAAQLVEQEKALTTVDISEPENIDLTIDDDSNDVLEEIPRPVGQVTAIDGNLQHEVSAALPYAPSKIRINISGLDVGASSKSPKSRRGADSPSTATAENGSDSTVTIANQNDSKGSSSPGGKSPVVNDSDLENKKDSEIVFTEEMKRLKPRLVGRKLSNQPPKKLGKEESGLCVIC